MAKEFKTIDQLVELMESRGIITDNKTAAAIKRESYYAIINGYKAPFLDREAMQSSAEDVYLEGTTFQPRRAAPSPPTSRRASLGSGSCTRSTGTLRRLSIALILAASLEAKRAPHQQLSPSPRGDFGPNRIYREGPPSAPLSSRSCGGKCAHSPLEHTREGYSSDLTGEGIRCLARGYA